MTYVTAKCNISHIQKAENWPIFEIRNMINNDQNIGSSRFYKGFIFSL